MRGGGGGDDCGASLRRNVAAPLLLRDGNSRQVGALPAATSRSARTSAAPETPTTAAHAPPTIFRVAPFMTKRGASVALWTLCAARTIKPAASSNGQLFGPPFDCHLHFRFASRNRRAAPLSSAPRLLTTSCEHQKCRTFSAAERSGSQRRRRPSQAASAA